MSEGILSLRFSPTHIELRPASQPVCEWSGMEREREREEKGRRSEQATTLTSFAFRLEFFFSLFSLLLLTLDDLAGSEGEHKGVAAVFLVLGGKRVSSGV